MGSDVGITRGARWRRVWGREWGRKWEVGVAARLLLEEVVEEEAGDVEHRVGRERGERVVGVPACVWGYGA